MYKLDQPRLAVTNPVTGTCFECGQLSALGEAVFWAETGYILEVSRWNGQAFVDVNSLPDRRVRPAE